MNNLPFDDIKFDENWQLFFKNEIFDTENHIVFENVSSHKKMNICLSSILEGLKSYINHDYIDNYTVYLINTYRHLVQSCMANIPYWEKNVVDNPNAKNRYTNINTNIFDKTHAVFIHVTSNEEYLGFE